MEQAVVKILLLGICGYGSNYIKEISERDIPGIKIEGICEVVPNAADLYPIIKEQNIPIYQTPEDFYKEHTADLAVVSTPIHLHYSQIVTCLTHGSNVLTEKPVCTSVEGARKLEQLEKETGKFISVGYQLNYSRDVLALKQDILDDRFGKPIYMKALHAMRRGDKYYARNSWAGHIDVKGCAVNDSPFNNACAHQFQVMTFLLGESLERAAELADVQADPYKGNPNVENFDTITVQAHTVSGVPLWYGTGHAIVDKKLGPIAEYRFEKGTVYFGKDFGSGPIAEYVYIPHGDTPVLVDVAMSMFSYGKLEVYKRSGRPLPVDGGLNKDQQPTKNAAEILETHESYPIGYWKGSGLSLALDLIAAALAGGRTTRQVGELPLETELSQVFICIDLDSLPDKENIAANVEATLRDMETSTPVEEGRPVHFPGAHMAEVRSDNMENGIPVEEAIWQQVLAL